jgi:hypothetical protein
LGGPWASAGQERESALIVRSVGVAALIGAFVACSGSSKGSHSSMPPPASPCQRVDGAAEDPAREFLEIETCPAQGHERVKGDSR